MYSTSTDDLSLIALDEPQKKAYRGITLIEALFWFMLLAIVAGGIFALSQSTFNTANASSETQIVNALQSGVKRIARGNYGTSSLMADLEAANLVPANIIDNSGSTTTYPNSWGGVYNVMGATNTYIVSSTNVPDESCVQILLTPTGGLIQSIEVDDTALASTEPTRAQAIAACSNGTQTLEWIFS